MSSSTGSTVEEIIELNSFRKTYSRIDSETALTVQFASGTAKYTVNGITADLTSGVVSCTYSN